MKVAVYPGSFDPITNGHLDIIKRAAKVFDEVIVVILLNPQKKSLFSVEERVELIKKVLKFNKNIKIECYNGLLVDFMREKGAKVIIKGLRAMSDFEYEFQMALMNNKLDPNVETVFMMTRAEYSYLSSSSVKQVAVFGGCIKGLVPDEIIPDIQRKSESQSCNKGRV
ncbi:phosphopantetheine adenylyltransferase [Clostridium pasteurianum DSM 525 = ATCC 6013]|uniref:Phosphopantetheine adenylyltransferase n=1 Tax=Clostridium pasteurianum DSM 525 = ATCC 6013 TaxID=1262449 RepID=A0A0H3J526_CLOPA|nr:pantetheine-phosphate adenylyltransferase [Clostridium pasteurianum]AJA48157.1 phosphopantetheine adenylyltransferase [Clostridium pasteurianum DSM 525 = ATCC 6013]AJA52145.1 phosphopantetheine adenylyltransferase [Clostridium pasteurianum DSM 525 = ATCC 6013]AOZ75419.1 phosphopantetheine adenylyltransferase [Clostridium pasteurianum DSM 525 = ATCC 6013]AOZ79214.1 phosphopantetheine adenylyltransferase [Clostridium pasteurianum]ELP60691.1 phosphopantetheine adenylyltransferase [Clostridium 